MKENIDTIHDNIESIKERVNSMLKPLYAELARKHKYILELEEKVQKLEKEKKRFTIFK